MSKLKIIPLGGMGNVTQNMFVYEYEDELLIVDCGIGFPDQYMPGVDLLIPDVRYVLEQIDKGKKIVGLIFTHGHDDHIGAAPYVIGSMPKFPIYASPLTAGFANQRLQDGGVDRHIQVVSDTNITKISDNFQAQFIPVTHSVPDTRNVVLHTPEGIIYHGSDFKLDTNPIDGVKTDFNTINKIADQGVLAMTIDCLRVERNTPTKSESETGPVVFKHMERTQGKCIVTLMSSHIHRIQQTINAAEKLGRKVTFIGRSVEQNVKVALNLKKLHIPKGMMIDKRDMQDHAANKLCVIIAGSQGQEGSSLMRAVFGEHRAISIQEEDTVIFSADAIPGNEIPYFNAVDELIRNGVRVVYPDIEPDIHQSGHAGRPEQVELVEAVRPKYILPVGGNDRHRYLFQSEVAEPLGYSPERVLLPSTGEILAFENQEVSVSDVLVLQPQIVDGLGIGDVGPIVLSDRRTLGQSGIVVVVVPRSKGKFDTRKVSVVSRGFIFMKEAEEVIEFIKETVGMVIENAGSKAKDDDIRRQIERKLQRKLYKIIQREPMVVPVILDI